ncbi:MAG: hypothetical protein LIO65_05100, partial [Odoribacter sp.]|nr:hypothetical protein [Odoribacter sp.]
MESENFKDNSLVYIVYEVNPNKYMGKTKQIDLSGKWNYTENYGYGTAKGELVLKQEGEQLSGRIIFSDLSEDNEEFMVQEFLEGKIEGVKVWLNAKEFDIIYSEHSIHYELDNWFGILVEEDVIK